MSPRIKRNRIIDIPPAVTGFNPTGCKQEKEMVIEIHFEEYEALKLADYNHLSHLEASRKMGVSRPTFTRIYDSVRKKIAQAFVEGLPIRVVGGYVDFGEDWFRCNDCHAVLSLKRGEDLKCAVCGSENIISLNESVKAWQIYRGRRKRASGIIEYCVCPSCYTKVKHEFGKPCNTYTCPECGHLMERE